MIIQSYTKAENLAEVEALLGIYQEQAVCICGATDFIITQHTDISKSVCDCIDISAVEALQLITEEDGIISIGAAVKLADIACCGMVKNHALILDQAAGQVGSPQIRNRASLGGNIITAAQCADTIPVLLALDAVLHIRRVDGAMRMVQLEDFFPGPKKTDLKKGELLTSISFPSLKAGGFSGVFYKLIRREAVAKSRLNFALIMQISDVSTVLDVRISIGAALSTPGRFSPVEQFLKGKKVSQEIFKQASEQCAEYVLASTGVRWSTPYKQPVIRDVMYSLLCECAGIKEQLHGK